MSTTTERAGSQDCMRRWAFAALSLGVLACSGETTPGAGRVRWSVELALEPGQRADECALALDPAGELVAARGGGRLHVYRADGRLAWQALFPEAHEVWFDAEPSVGSVDRRFDLTGDPGVSFGTGMGHRAAPDSAGSPVVLGDSLELLDAERVQVWEVKLVFELGSSQASAVRVDSEDAVVLAWKGMGIEDCPSQLVLRKYSHDGVLQWSQCVPIAHLAGRVPVAIDPRNDDVLIAGETPDSQPRDGRPREWSLVRYSARGAERWRRPFATWMTSREGLDDLVESALADITVDEEGEIAVIGRILGRDPEVSQDIQIQKLDAEGSPLWTTVVKTPARQDDQGLRVQVDAEGHVYALGRLDRPEDRSRPAHTRLWLARLEP